MDIIQYIFAFKKTNLLYLINIKYFYQILVGLKVIFNIIFNFL